MRTSQTRTARSAPSVARRVPSALNRVAKTPPRCARRTVNQVAGGGIPEPRGAVGASGRDEPPVRAVPDREDLCLCARRASRASCRCARRECSPSRPRGRLRRSGIASGARATTCPMPVLRPTPCTADSTREVASASWRACSASGEHGAVVPPGRLRGFDREQDAPLGIDLEVRLRGRSQLARRREARVVPRLVAEDERERRERRGRGGEHREPCQRRPPPPRPPPGRRVRRGTRLGEERALAGGQGEVGRARPGFELRQPALARQVLRIAPCVLPLSRPPRRAAGGGGGRSRRSSIHPRSRSHWDRIASCATSTVGVRVSGSRSKVSRRCSP